MLTYSQTTGRLTDERGELWGVGYSGHGAAGKNNPLMQQVPDVGPLPQGWWKAGTPGDSPHTGPYTIPLEPVNGTQTFGRTGFKIHGDSKGFPGTASHGCLIFPRAVRERVHQENRDGLIGVTE